MQERVELTRSKTQVARNALVTPRVFPKSFSTQRLSPVTIDYTDFDPYRAAEILPQIGLLVIKRVPETEILKMTPAGAVALRQYEGVFDNRADPYTLRIVADEKPAIHTTAFKQKSTTKHQDGYQFPSPYKGVAIAGPGNMPDYEFLAYPSVGDQRVLFFAGLAWAASKLPPAVYDQLQQPDYIIENDDYRRFDPDLRGGSSPILYKDGDGLRFHVGSKMRALHPDAEFALTSLLEIANEDQQHFWLEPGDVYLTWQRWVCHYAIRSRPAIGFKPTVLVRRLLRRTM